MYTIKEISQMFGLPASTIRYYEEIGLLDDVRHVNRYRREYKDFHIEKLQAIECFKRARLSLADIKQFFNYEKNIEEHSKQILQMMKKQEQKTREEMNQLQRGIEHIQKKIKYYTIVDEAIAEGKNIPKWEDVMNE